MSLHFATKSRPSKEYKPTVSALAPRLQGYVDRQVGARQALADDAIARHEADPQSGDAVTLVDKTTTRLIAAVRVAVRDGYSVTL